MSDPSASEVRTLVGRASLPAYQTSDRLEPLFTTYERNLPHWRLTGANYFVTWRLHGSQPDLSPAERDLVRDAICHFDGARYRLFAWVVMNDHAHALLKPSEGVELEEILHTWKSFTARQLQHDHKRCEPARASVGVQRDRRASITTPRGYPSRSGTARSLHTIDIPEERRIGLELRPEFRPTREVERFPQRRFHLVLPEPPDLGSDNIPQSSLRWNSSEQRLRWFSAWDLRVTLRWSSRASHPPGR